MRFGVALLLLLLSGVPVPAQTNSVAVDTNPAPSNFAVPEQLHRLDPGRAEVRWSGASWQLWAGEVCLKDFGRHERDAQQAMRIVRELGVTQRGTVGSPHAIMEYWLVQGRAPDRPVEGFRTNFFDPASLRVVSLGAEWCVRDASQILFTFGSHAEEARQALAIIQHYQFNEIGYVGLPAPTMIVFLALPRQSASSGSANDSQDPHSSPRSGRAEVERQMLAALNRPGTAVLPGARQLSVPMPTPAGAAGPGERIPIDWRHVRLQQTRGEWTLVDREVLLARFGTDEVSARRALATLQQYRFTECCRVGQAEPRFTYFLNQGQAPRGVRFGTDGRRFYPDAVAVRVRDDGAVVLSDGGQLLIPFGTDRDAAEQAVRAIHQFHFDYFCRIGPAKGGLTFFVHAR